MAALPSSEGSSYFVFSTIRRCHSQPQLAGRTPTSQSGADPRSDPYHQSRKHPDPASSSVSSPPPIHGESMDMPCSSTPASDISIPSDYNEGIHLVEPSAEHSWLPQLLKDSFFTALDDGLEPRPDLKAGDSYTVSPIDHDNPADTSTGGTPVLREFYEPAKDDSALNAQPWRNVDYLSHDLKEEDIWSLWKYITSRRGENPNSARLENASWRAWIKYKNHLKSVSPETLNWLKDSDVTWLYGPVQPGASKIYRPQTGPSGALLFQSNSLVNIYRKPILKKRSISDIMLQRPSSSSPLPQQTTPVAEAREKDSRRKTTSFDWTATTDHTMFPLPSTPMSRDTSMLPSSASTGISSPGVERKHIHFNDKVEQCIAVEVKGDDDDINTDTSSNGDSNSDDGIMMKLERPRKPAPMMGEKAEEGKNSLPSNGKTIAMLPSTTLKHREHVLEVPETAIHYNSSILRSRLVSPFSPQETARPPKALGRFFGEEKEEEDMMDADTDAARYSSGSFEEHGLHRTTSTDSLAAEPAGMFMPYEEVATSSNKGIFCRVIDVFNTAWDIAYVIWNSGWR